MTEFGFADQLYRFLGQIEACLERSPDAKACSYLRAAEGVDRVLNAESARIWEARLKECPDDATALHHLAIIYHGMAIEAERDIVAGQAYELVRKRGLTLEQAALEMGCSEQDVSKLLSEADRKIEAAKSRSAPTSDAAALPGEADPKKIRDVWLRAMRCWSALSRQEAFWDGVKQGWQKRKEEGKDGLASLFDPVKWDAFRRRLGSLLLQVHEQRIRQAIVKGRKDLARAYMGVVKGSGFDPADTDPVRTSLYNLYRCDDRVVLQDASYEAAIKRIQEYLDLDADFAEPLHDVVLVSTHWVGYLLSGETESSAGRARIEKVIDRGCKCALHAALQARVKGNAVMSQELSDFFMAARSYYMQKTQTYYAAGEVPAALDWLDKAWNAAHQAMRFETLNVLARPAFLGCLHQAVDLRLDRCEEPSGGDFDEAEKLLALGLAEAPSDPNLLRDKARTEGVKGNMPQFKRLLKQAGEEAGKRSDPDCAEKIARMLEHGPHYDRAVTLRNEAGRDLEAGRLSSAEDKVRKVLKILPNDAIAEFYLGRIHMDAGRPRESLKMFKQARDHARQQGLTQLVDALANVPD